VQQRNLKGESISIAFDELRNISSQGTKSPLSKGGVGTRISCFRGVLMLKRCLGPRIFILIHFKTTRFPDKPSYKWNCLCIRGNTYDFTLSIQPFSRALLPSWREISFDALKSTRLFNNDANDDLFTTHAFPSGLNFAPASCCEIKMSWDDVGKRTNDGGSELTIITLSSLA